MMISQIFRIRNIQTNLRSRTKEELFDELLDILAENETVPDRETVKQSIWSRERIMNTGIAPHIAIPHTQVKGMKRAIGVMGISRKGIIYGARDAKPVHLVMLFVDDEADPVSHLETVRNAAILVKNPRFYQKVMKCMTAVKIFHTIQNFEDIEKIYYK